MVTLTNRPIAPVQAAATAGAPAESRSTGSPSPAALSDETAKNLVQLFKLLADDTRLQVLYFLVQEDELNVRTLCKLLHQSQPAVSHHLALLRDAGVIECRRDGKHNFYHLVPKRCQAYLDMIFGTTGDQPRKVRVEDAVVTYSRDGRASA
jgi:ArsR family transcriptional regulator, arsenate/arsenite/antimonite-responsive transcriptional repressor